MANEEPRERGISFDVNFNNHETVDISIQPDLSERVIVKRGEGGRHDIHHAAEPQGTPGYADAFWTLYDGDTLLAEWKLLQATP